MLSTFSRPPERPEPARWLWFLILYFDRSLVDSEVADEFRLLTSKASSTRVNLGIVGDAPVIRLLRYLWRSLDHERQDGLLFSRGAALEDHWITTFRDRGGLTKAVHSFGIRASGRSFSEYFWPPSFKMRRWRGRRADGAIPPARYRRAAGIPGENARLTALAMLIFKLRQR